MYIEPLVTKLLIAQDRKLIHSCVRVERPRKQLHICFNENTSSEVIQNLTEHIERAYKYKTQLSKVWGRKKKYIWVLMVSLDGSSLGGIISEEEHSEYKRQKKAAEAWEEPKFW